PPGCPGANADPAPTANYPCPNGGVVINGNYYADAGQGRVQGKLTWSDGQNNGPCPNAVVTVTRIDGSADGDIATTTAADGGFVLMVGAGNLTLSASNCKATNGNIWSGNSATITATAGKITDGSFSAQVLQQAGANQPGVCDNVKFTELNWWICAGINVLKDAVSGLTDGVLSAIKIDTNSIFNDDNTSRAGNAFFVAWAAFRNIGYGVLLVVGLLMLLSQILGLDIFSALDIKHLLPKLPVIILLMAFMWNIQDWGYNASNDAAGAVQSIIAAPFSRIDPGLGNTAGNITIALLIPQLLATSVAVGVAALALLGLGGIAALMLSLFLAGASAFFLIEARDVVAEILIMSASLVLALSLVFKKILDFWLGLTGTILLSVPTMAAIMQAGEEGAKLAYVNGHIVVALGILGAVFGLFWKTFKTIDKVSGNIGNATAAVTDKARKGLNNYASKSMKRRTQEAVNGTRRFRGPAGTAVEMLRRGQMADKGGLQALLPGRAGNIARMRYEAAESGHLQHEAAEALKRDDGRAAGDDLAMKLALARGMTDERFLREYTAAATPQFGAAEAERRASAALGSIRDNIGQLGSGVTRVAAYKALGASKTSYTDETGENVQDNWEEMIGDGVSLMQDGLMTSVDVTRALKSNGERGDRAGVGFGGLQGQVERSFGRYQVGARRGQTSAAAATAANPLGNLVTENEAIGMRREAGYGSGHGSIMNGRHEALEAIAPQLTRDVQQANANLAASQAAEAAIPALSNPVIRQSTLDTARAVPAGSPLTAEQAAVLQTEQARDALLDQLVDIDRKHANPASPQLADILKRRVMSQDSGALQPAMMLGPDPHNFGNVIPIANPNAGQPMTVQQQIEFSRTQQGWVEKQREYASTMAAQMAQATANASDRRVKRNIAPVGMAGSIQLYRFQYLWSDQVYIGVMAQDLLESHPEAVVTGADGFYRVNYAILGLQMYTLEEWEARTEAATKAAPAA
ncbi:MAG TPA: tail fiber domain-containing protein, partial [Candidatus Saccharimonadales bacterium]|nr:tail fiber domain-containing protein [Candidatus Saccharimonadales bacterium]